MNAISIIASVVSLFLTLLAFCLTLKHEPEQAAALALISIAISAAMMAIQ